MTQNKKHILLTTDFSEESFQAFEPVNDLAAALGAKVSLLYVLPSMDHHATGTPFVSPVPIPSDEQQLDLARKDMEKLRERFDSSIDLELVAQVGEEIPEVILNYADANGVDIIAICTHARRGLSRLVMGSVVEEVIRNSKVPVYAIPQVKK